MQSLMRKSVVLAGVFLVFAGATANASAVTNVVEVKVPVPFVVNGHTLPAGEYRFERDDNPSSVLYIRGENSNHAAAFALTRPAGGQDPAGEIPALRLTLHDNQYVLSSVWESGSVGWSILSR